MQIDSIGDVTIEVGDLKFILRPREYTDFMFWRGKINELEIEDPATQAMGYAAAEVFLRVKDWEGIETRNGNGELTKAPCNTKTKNALFTQRPDLLNQIALKAAELEGAVEKNSETSQAGSTD